MRKCGLEWVFRLLQEPRRLLKRYAADLAVFGCGSMKELTGALVYHKSSRS
jgi:UDP-N-acetyl-D-mannosaminuronic acid transferase (WecB/TagA/CpsF family)